MEQYLPSVCYQVSYSSVVLSDIPRSENLNEDQISKRLLELDEEWEKDGCDSFSFFEANGESDCVLDSLGSVSSSSYSSSSKDFILQYSAPKFWTIPFCDRMETCFTIFMQQNLLELICK